MSIVMPVVVIGIVALIFTIIGMFIGNRVAASGKFGKRAGLIGGVILILIGIKILLSTGHLISSCKTTIRRQINHGFFFVPVQETGRL